MFKKTNSDVPICKAFGYFVSVLILMLFLGIFGWTEETEPLNEPFPFEKMFKTYSYQQLLKSLKKQEFTQEEIEAIFNDPRVVLYKDLFPKPKQPEQKPKQPKKYSNPYLNPERGFNTPESVELCKKFLEDKKDIFDLKEKEYEVDREVLVSIFKLETNLGYPSPWLKNPLGDHLVFNALNTRFYLEVVGKRAKSTIDWDKQLVAWLKICRQNQIDPLSVYGSKAGAFGYSQFMPTSYLTFAVDGNGDGKIDLFTWPDAIASTANFLKEHGWKFNKLNQKSRGALFSYNRQKIYIEAIIYFAQKLGWQPNQ